MQIVMKNDRPPRPDGMEDWLWELIVRCWAHDPEKRPNVRQVLNELIVKKAD